DGSEARLDGTVRPDDQRGEEACRVEREIARPHPGPPAPVTIAVRFMSGSPDLASLDLVSPCELQASGLRPGLAQHARFPTGSTPLQCARRVSPYSSRVWRHPPSAPSAHLTV